MKRTSIAVVLCGFVFQSIAGPFGDGIRERCAAALVAGRGDAAGGIAQATAAADDAAGWAGAGELASIGWGEGTLRLLDTARRARTGVGGIADHPEFAVELGLLVDRRDDAKGVIGLAKALCDERGVDVDAYPALAAAVCVVHDNGYARRINENGVKSPGGLAVFDYFVRHAGAMALDPARTPALLLVHVVDVTESVDQLEWALARYGKRPEPGKRFFEIRYDVDHFRKGTPKKVTAAGNYRIESILANGGVCADQAYYAEEVGKAAGLATCYVVARSAEVGHAWIGYFDTRTRAWDFDHGRYPEYQNLRGNVQSPQTGAVLSDAAVGLLGGLATARGDDVRAAMGAWRASERMADAEWSAGVQPDGPSARGVLRDARTGSIDDRLDLLRSGLSACASVPGAWETMAGFAEKGELSMRQKDEWAKAVDRMCGTRYADFSFDTLSSLIGSVGDTKARQGMWEWAFARFRSRPDLASAVRFEQGAMFEKAGDLPNAWAAYQDVVKNFLDDGPMSVSALESMLEMLEREGKTDAALPLLQEAAGRVKSAGDMGGGFRSQSNEYRINAMLIAALERAGRTDEAKKVREKTGITG